MKIAGFLVYLLVEMAPEVYGPYDVYEDGCKVLNFQLLITLYGVLVAYLIWYKKLGVMSKNKDLSLILTASVLQ